jgi:3'-5' exoribonuclease
MAPAAKANHHAYIGGLLEHTLNVTELCVSIASRYREVNFDLLIAGALLHDIGKVEEYTYFPKIDRTDIGRLLGHLVIGYEMIMRKIREMKNFRGGFPEDLKLQILHLVISHHGELEWGSPVRPMTLEAQILHFADNMDSKVWMFIDAKRKRRDPFSRWSEYLQSLIHSKISDPGQERHRRHQYKRYGTKHPHLLCTHCVENIIAKNINL